MFCFFSHQPLFKVSLKGVSLTQVSLYFYTVHVTVKQSNVKFMYFLINNAGNIGFYGISLCMGLQPKITENLIMSLDII